MRIYLNVLKCVKSCVFFLPKGFVKKTKLALGLGSNKAAHHFTFSFDSNPCKIRFYRCNTVHLKCN